jgi:hypothetical protein
MYPMLKASLFAAVAVLAAQPAIAGQDTTTAAKPIVVTGKGKAGDPNRMVCQREETTGTRLGARRICLTAAQWEEKRRVHREELERAQRNVGIANEG